MVCSPKNLVVLAGVLVSSTPAATTGVPAGAGGLLGVLKQECDGDGSGSCWGTSPESSVETNSP